jgi:tRNA modification GTPase
MDTIVAIATSQAGSAGINIIRISGEDSLQVATSIFQSKNISGKMLPNTMYLGTIKAKLYSEKAFCVYFKAPKSYTGEDIIEIHCHGGIGIANAIVRLVREYGVRPAEPGEFTKRAFLNNKLNLVEAEGILDMINASTEGEMNNAYRLMSGEVSKEIASTERLLIETIAMLEAKLDYPEELEEDTRPKAIENLIKIKENLSRHEKNSRHAKTLKQGVNIAIVGAPNAGKSSLLNALIKEDRAIVTDIAGTTRDVVSESIQVDGIKLNFLDTAGIREGQNVIEEIGIGRSKKAIKGAEIVIFVKDGSVEKSKEEEEIEKLLKEKRVITVVNKCDIKKEEKQGLQISVKQNINIDIIFEKIMEMVNRESIFSQPVLTNERQLFALQACLGHIKSGIESYDYAPTECVLVDLHQAVIALAKITGKDVSESIVEEVFSAFCVGK